MFSEEVLLKEMFFKRGKLFLKKLMHRRYERRKEMISAGIEPSGFM